jgi:glutaconate CoA-transferase subunit B
MTSPGHLDGRTDRAKLGIPGGGPQRVITDRALFDFDAATKEMTLVEVAPGETAETIQADIAWELKVSPNLKEITPPTPTELTVIREELDPTGLYR